MQLGRERATGFVLDDMEAAPASAVEVAGSTAAGECAAGPSAELERATAS